jgi:hypothetical protein
VSQAYKVYHIKKLPDLHSHGKQKHPQRKKLYFVWEKHSCKTAKKYGNQNIAAIGTDKRIPYKQGDKHLDSKQNHKSAKKTRACAGMSYFHGNTAFLYNDYIKKRLENKGVFYIITVVLCKLLCYNLL